MNSELYTVLKYYPETETCDLYPANQNGRGALSRVAIAVGHGGAWENQQRHNPPLENRSDPSQFGNVERGPRWGQSFPVQEGDIAEVHWLGMDQSVPIIKNFLHHRGVLGPAWVASKIGDRPDGLPESDKEPDNRYDLLLPSGAWLRSTKDGSWTIATPPVDAPKAFIVLHANGDINIHAEGTVTINAAKIDLNP